MCIRDRCTHRHTGRHRRLCRRRPFLSRPAGVGRERTGELGARAARSHASRPRRQPAPDWCARLGDRRSRRAPCRQGDGLGRHRHLWRHRRRRSPRAAATSRGRVSRGRARRHRAAACRLRDRRLPAPDRPGRRRARAPAHRRRLDLALWRRTRARHRRLRRDLGLHRARLPGQGLDGSRLRAHRLRSRLYRRTPPARPSPGPPRRTGRCAGVPCNRGARAVPDLARTLAHRRAGRRGARRCRIFPCVSGAWRRGGEAGTPAEQGRRHGRLCGLLRSRPRHRRAGDRHGRRCVRPARCLHRGRSRGHSRGADIATQMICRLGGARVAAREARRTVRKAQMIWASAATAPMPKNSTVIAIGSKSNQVRVRIMIPCQNRPLMIPGGLFPLVVAKRQKVQTRRADLWSPPPREERGVLSTAWPSRVTGRPQAGQPSRTWRAVAARTRIRRCGRAEALRIISRAILPPLRETAPP